MSELILHKMNGLGNNFLILDQRNQPDIQLTDADILDLCSSDNQKTGGCDQFITIKNSADRDAFMQIHNADGGEVDACGNATRCVVSLLQKNPDIGIFIETNTGKISGKVVANNIVEVEMPEPDFNWQAIPLVREVDDVLSLPIDFNGVNGAAVSMGNPHLVFIINHDVEKLVLENIGPEYENDALYPERTNVSFANVIDRRNIRLRVFERGVGETAACGTGACATHVIANCKGLVEGESVIHLNGGDLKIEWDSKKGGSLFMTGETEYEGKIKLSI